MKCQSQDEQDRMLRMNGQKPTARELWTAFHRLYRMALRRHPHSAVYDVAPLFWTLTGRYRWVRLLESNGDDLVAGLPPFLRKSIVETNRRMRLEKQLVAAIMAGD